MIIYLVNLQEREGIQYHEIPIKSISVHKMCRKIHVEGEYLCTLYLMWANCAESDGFM